MFKDGVLDVTVAPSASMRMTPNKAGRSGNLVYALLANRFMFNPLGLVPELYKQAGRAPSWVR